MKTVFSLDRGQSVIEIALLIGIIGLVVIGMEAYLRRGMQGKVKSLTDYIISDQQAPDEDAADTESSTSLKSTMTNQELLGGGRKLTGKEESTYQYSQ
ncbi:MAG: hypothetical protein PHO34_05295 [Candidatus Omnitrophica bacterium]|nr:hypothetical protein [Candidatus Omnitrophota bacterium]MDD5500967.1 hypothetical protein [Candidatus Omnitrophota bacterium]